MIKSFLNIAWRNLVRNKAFSFINIIGLAAGLTTCLLIMLYIFDESAFDKHHKDVDRLYRVASIGSNGETWAAGPAPLAAGLKNELPEVAVTTRLLTFPDIATKLMKYQQPGETKEFFETNGYYVDSSFFHLFTYNFTFGNSATALNDPNSTVISTELSTKFFGKQNPIGKYILITTPFGEFNYTVKGVFDRAKNKSHIPANFFLTMRNNDMWKWVQTQTKWATNNVFYTYVKLNEDVDKKRFETKMQTLFNKYAGADMKTAGFSKTLFLQPVKDIYLRSAIGNEIGANGNITSLYILGSIAAFILLIACINFMNLSTARSQKRAREVGVRKVMGARKSILIRQFIGESFFMSLLALVLAIILLVILLPVFNSIAQKEMHLMDEPYLFAGIAILSLITGLLSGLYPAFYLSAFKPISVLKGKIVNSFSATTIRKGLVVFQFTISTCLIFAAIIIWQQLDLFKHKQLGFNKDHQLVLPMQRAYKNTEKDYTPLKNELLKIPGVTAVTSGSTYPGIPDLNDMLFYPEGKTADDMVDIRLSAIENNYIENLGMKIVSGRSFSNQFTGDSASIILNEVAVRKLGYEANEAIGKKIQYDHSGKHASLEIIGVVKNFNFESLHTDIKPCGFTNGIFSDKYGYVIASIKTDNYAAMLATIGEKWNLLNPGIPFLYSFMDKDFQANYEKEERTSTIIIYFTLIAALIACLGLFGLSAFSAEQRTKEIGIRKVLGASVFSITSLLSKDFVRLIVIAMVIALPIGWFFMNKWLQNFAYRINISWWMFVAAGILAIFIALVTVSFQAIKAAIANPSNSLRAE